MEFQVVLETENMNTDKSDERFVTIGQAKVHIVDQQWLEDNFMDLIEQIHFDFNAELNWNEPTIYEFLEDSLKCVDYGQEKGLQGKIAVLHTISIRKEYRGQGYFPEFMNRIIDYVKKFSCDYLILQPCPFGEAWIDPIKLEKGIQRLRRFYETFGFRNYPIEKGKPYMYLSLSEGMSKRKVV